MRHSAIASVIAVMICLAVASVCSAATVLPIVFTAPSGGEQFYAGQTQTIRLDLKTKAKQVEIKLSRDGGATFPESLGIINNLNPDKTKRFLLTYQVSGAAASNCKLQAVSKTDASTGVSPAFAISTGAVADNSVPTTALLDGSVTTPKLADGAVTNPKIADRAVSAPKITSETASAFNFLCATGTGGAQWIPIDATALSGVTAVANGGTGSATKNFVDLSTAQTVNGAKTFTADFAVGNAFVVQRNPDNLRFDNLFIGQSAGIVNNTGSANTAIGTNAFNSNTVGIGNTAIGKGALHSNTTGIYNMASGNSALYSNTTGNNNTASGKVALTSNTTGSNNIGIGSGAGFNLTTGDNNIDIGNAGVGGEANTIRIGTPGTQTDAYIAGVLFANDGLGVNNTFAVSPSPNNSGNNNFFAGFDAGVANSKGDYNAATGNYALYSNTLGNFNTATGGSALYNNTTGSFNIGIGSNAGANLTTGGFNIDIGNEGVAGEAKTIRIGTPGVQTDAYIAGVLFANDGLGVNNTFAVSPSPNNSGLDSFFAGFGAGVTNSIGNYNTATGNYALYNNTAGNNNMATGAYALFNNSSGNSNTAIGNNALANIATGNNNIGIGDSAGFNLDTGDNNIDIGNDGVANDSNTTRIGTPGTQTNAYIAGILHADDGFSVSRGTAASFTVEPRPANTASGSLFLGLNAGLNNTSGSNNVFIGINAGQSNATSNNCVYIGTNAGKANISGATGTFIGNFSGRSNTTGGANTFVGGGSGMDNTTGTGNIALGQGAGQNLTTGDNNIDIGNDGVAGETKTIRIGSASQTKAFISGIRGITTGVNNAVNVVIDGNGQLGTVSSSARYKEDIRDMGDASAKIQALRPVTFRYKKPYDNGDKPIQFGLIAEEVAKAFPELAVFNADGQPETVKYQDLTPMLLNEYLKEHSKVGELTGKLEELTKKLEAQESRIKALEAPTAR